MIKGALDYLINIWNYFFNLNKSLLNKSGNFSFTQKISKQSIDFSNPIHVLLNDDTTPDLNKSITPFDYNKVKFQVKNYQGGGFLLDTDQGRAANVYVHVANCLNMVEKYTPMFNTWAGTSNLIVLPNAGKDFNAFYNRRSMQFFSGKDPVRGVHVHTSKSSDIVTHELGHAILDSFRPDTWSVAALEVWSFHEAFADITAFLYILQYEEIISRFVEQTNGDLRKENVACSLAESMGEAIFNLTKDTSRPKNYLRSAINDFKYVNPGTLPESAPDHLLAAECHSFGRVFLGAFYDIFEMIYQSAIESGKSPKEAVVEARDTLGNYVFKAIKNAPLCVNFYESMCKTILWVAWNDQERKFHDKIKAIFYARNLIKREFRILSEAPSSNEEGLFKTGNVVSLKLSNHVLRAQGESDNQLYDVEADVPAERAYFYDLETGVAIDFINSSDTDIIAALQDAMIYLHHTKQVGSEKMFEISNGKLQRRNFS
jgi:hypothetical protein